MVSVPRALLRKSRRSGSYSLLSKHFLVERGKEQTTNHAKMTSHAKGGSVLLLVIAFASWLLPGADMTCSTSDSVQCGSVSSAGSCRYRNCSDAQRGVDVSFRACQVPGPEDARSAGEVSIYTYTNVTLDTATCNCEEGDITIEVKLPDNTFINYRTGLTEMPNPNLLNASRCDSESTEGETYSYCIKFTNLRMAVDVNGSELVAEVTSAFELRSSTSCMVLIVLQAEALIPSVPPPTGSNSGSPAVMFTHRILAFLLPLLGYYVIVKLQEGALLFSV